MSRWPALFIAAALLGTAMALVVSPVRAATGAVLCAAAERPATGCGW